MSLKEPFGLRGDRPRFGSGQRWAYNARREEASSTLLIQKVEEHPVIGNIFHISILDVKIKRPDSAGGVVTEMAHAPVSLQTLGDSCTELVETCGPDERYLEGYAQWKEAFDRGGAGVFTISVAEIVEGIEAAVGGGQDEAL